MDLQELEKRIEELEKAIKKKADVNHVHPHGHSLPDAIGKSFPLENH